jgi:Flp pilus assembly protein TadD
VRGRRYEEALKVLESAARIRVRDPAVHYQMVIAYSRLKKTREADRELELFRKLDEERKARSSDGREDGQIEDALPKSASEGKP